MLKIWDAHNFRRTLTGLSLIAAPLVLLVTFVVLPDLPDDPTAMLAAIAANRERTVVAALLFMLSSVLFLPAFVGLIHLLRDRGVVLGHLGGGLALLGVWGHIALATHWLVYVQMTMGGAEQTQMVALMNRIEGDTALLPVTLTQAGSGIGFLLLGIGLWRARVGPRWAAVGIVLAIVLVIMGAVIIGGEPGPIIIWVVLAGLAISLGAIGWTVLRMSDGDWERLPEQGDKRLQAAH
jgi:Domain of unknown function (DUF4386)